MVMNSLRMFAALVLVTATSCRSTSESGHDAQTGPGPSLSYSTFGGCGGISVYGGSEDQTEWLRVLVDRRDHELSATSRSFDLAEGAEGIYVFVELFAAPGDPEYCNDAPLELHLPTETWRARSGMVTVTLIGAKVPFTFGDEEPYVARVRLDSCVFISPGGRTRRQDSTIEMEANVGYYPG